MYHEYVTASTVRTHLEERSDVRKVLLNQTTENHVFELYFDVLSEDKRDEINRELELYDPHLQRETTSSGEEYLRVEIREELLMAR